MRASARVWVRAWLHIQLSLDGFSSNLMWHILQMTTSYTACTCVRASIQQIPRGCTSHIICVWMHVLTARTSIYSRICQARDGQWLVQIKPYNSDVMPVEDSVHQKNKQYESSIRKENVCNASVVRVQLGMKRYLTGSGGHLKVVRRADMQRSSNLHLQNDRQAVSHRQFRGLLSKV
jgi:hypothetical protein